MAFAIWSLASGCSGLATSFAVLLCTRLFVGIGEAGHARPRRRSSLIFIPLLSDECVLGLVFTPRSRVEARWATRLAERLLTCWAGRWAFYLVVPAGVVARGVLFFYVRAAGDNMSRQSHRPTPSRLQKFVSDSFLCSEYGTAAMTVMTFRHWRLFCFVVGLHFSRSARRVYVQAKTC